MEDKIFREIIELVSIMNRPDRDKKLIASTGLQLEEASFKVLVGIAHLRETSVGHLADLLGRNYSSISRQIDKLEATGLVYTYPSKEDSRIRMSELTEYGKEINSLIQSARKRLMMEALSEWNIEEKQSLFNNLLRLNATLTKFD